MESYSKSFTKLDGNKTLKSGYEVLKAEVMAHPRVKEMCSEHKGEVTSLYD